ncbi:50S ribosomal protein L25/general stress protein Ctc [Massilia sp. W12]|uniref:50S ribosomal protein L25/general stress protein Ctc n=1 Tax=Massilia sp. W12 TaxID=3126507 RepID=UPI0030D580E7
MKISAKKRDVQGTGASRRLRHAGVTPGIVYGSNGQAGCDQAVYLTLDHNELFHALKKERFHSSVLELDLDGKSEQVLLRDFQMHAFKPLVLHVDFQRVDPARKIHMKIALHFKNAEISPAVKLHSGKITHVMNELEVICLPKDLPEFVEVDLSKMDAGSIMHVSDLVLPEGVAAAPGHGGSKQTVAFVTVPPKQVEAAPAADTKKKGKK